MYTFTNRAETSFGSPESLLNYTVKSWVAIALLGQWMFAIYILSVYAMPSLLGQPDVTLSVSPATGTEKADGFDFVIFFAHIVPAALMAMSGLLQFFPNIRKRFPQFHRYNGRMFFILGVSGALSGLYLTWGAGLRLSDIGAIGITLNGILIPIAIYFAWRTAVNKQFSIHQRFAVHSFLLVNGVWTFRLYLMAWYILNQGGNGNTRNIDGPADIAISFACYLLPMAIAELVFWAKRTPSAILKRVITGITASGALLTLIGVGAAGMMMWYPRVVKVFEGVF